METNLRESFIRTKDPVEVKYLKFIDWEFDYEINNFLEDEENSQLFNNGKGNENYEKSVKLINDSSNENTKTQNNLNNFSDELAHRFYKCEPIFCLKKKFIKKIISKQKIRLINKDFDLDLIYITRRVMAMGFPAVGCESLIRNSLADVRRFFQTNHDNNVKVYNLCLETDRLYSKERFPDCELGLFPFSDHQTCPVRLMLEFCVDLVLYLSKNPENVAAVHCKAGKGRTGIMICCYLLFSGLSENTLRAFQDYAERRSHQRKGVTIPSQKRYIHHFETYLNCNFEKPFIKLIPKICKYYLKPHRNILIPIFKDKVFRDVKNSFNISKIKIGPFTNKHYLSFFIEDFKKHVKFDSKSKFEKVNFKHAIKEEIINNKTINYSILEFNEPFIVDKDINIKISSKHISFNCWLNFFYITLEYYFFMIDEFLNNQIISNAPAKDKKIATMVSIQNQIFSDATPSNYLTNQNNGNSNNINTNNISKAAPSKGNLEMKDLSSIRKAGQGRNNNLSISNLNTIFGSNNNNNNGGNIKANYLNNLNNNTQNDNSADLTSVAMISEKNSNLVNNNLKSAKDHNINNVNTINNTNNILIGNLNDEKDIILNFQSKRSNEIKAQEKQQQTTDKAKLKEIEDKLNKIYSNAFDANYYWKNDVVFNGEKIKNFLKDNTNFIDDNIQMFDLNNIYKYFFDIHSEYFENQKKEFKIKFDALGVDKFGIKKTMMPGFCMEIKYNLC